MDLINPGYIIPVNETQGEKVAEITESMEQNGWIGDPIVIVPYGDGWQALTGSHRLAAAIAAGLDEIPAECIESEALTAEQWDEMDRCHEAEAWLRALEGFAADGTDGLEAAISLLEKEAEKEWYL